MQFQGKLLYLGEQGMEFKNEQGQEIKMTKVRFMALDGTITIFDFNIQDEKVKSKLASVQPSTPIECLFEMGARKDMKAFVRLLDVSVSSLKQK